MKRIKPRWWAFLWFVALCLSMIWALADEPVTVDQQPHPISQIYLPPLGVVTRIEADTNPAPMSVGLTTYEPHGIVTRPVPLDPMTPLFSANVRPIGTNDPPGVTNDLVFYYPVSVGKLPLFDVQATTNEWKSKFLVFSNLQYGSVSPLYSTSNAPAMKFKGVRHQ